MLPVPLELLSEIMNTAMEDTNLLAIYTALPDDSFAALQAIIAVGREVLADSEYPVTSTDYYEAYAAAKKKLANSPQIRRLELAGIIAAGRYIEEGLRPAQELGIRFLSLQEYWSSKRGNPPSTPRLHQGPSHKDQTAGMDSHTARRDSLPNPPNYSFRSKVEPTDEQVCVLDAATRAVKELYIPESLRI